MAGAASYPLQRLLSAASGEVAYGSIIAQEHVPYYWRAVLALFHAAVIGLIIGLGSTDAQAARSLGWIPWAVAALVPLAFAMAVFP